MQKKRIVVVLNILSGNAGRVDEKKVIGNLSNEYEILRVCHIKNKADTFDICGADAVAVYGGDGTLNSVLRKVAGKDIEIFYCPSGTLNEVGKTLKKKYNKKLMLTETGVLAGNRFAYVAATGTFTSIGVKTSPELKKRFKLVAYFGDVLRCYKVAHIAAKFETDNGIFEDVYTLAMFIDSNRCFGFSFNRLFEPNDGKLHMLLIKAPKGSGLLAKIKIFFPMFRVFFMGISKAKTTKNIVFVPISTAKVSLETPQTFCFDGEAQIVEGKFLIEVAPLTCPIKLIGI
ncbi:MAG: diacylglycerol kinase family protein [Clostridia bacterium]|nr:diacylglycerol kinase family protein [Clostridia bacterium]